MEIILLRHGIAEPRGLRRIADRDRLLTAEGVRGLRRTGRWLQSRKTKPSVIYSSPYRRAVQSAEIIGGFLPEAKLRFSETLTPEGDVRKAAALLARQNPGLCVLVSSHEPFLGRFAGYLLSGRDQVLAKFKKGGAMQLFWQTPSEGGAGAVMKWLVSPRMLAQKKGAR